jgi:hypothetical protein
MSPSSAGHNAARIRLPVAKRFSACLRVLALIAGLCAAGCGGKKPIITEDMLRFEGPMPADFSGSWERDYSRGDDIYAVLNATLRALSRNSPDPRLSAQARISASPDSVSSRQRAATFAIAQLADEITRLQVLTISQSDSEILIERKDDYAIFCAFYGGAAKATESGFGAELCGWDGDHLVSQVVLPDGLQIVHRFTVSEDGKQLRVITSVLSSEARLPITLSRFYTKFEAPTSDFNCVETLSMKRVCSTGDLDL